MPGERMVPLAVVFDLVPSATICRQSAGQACARLPIQKKVARPGIDAGWPVPCGVTSGSGPSSKSGHFAAGDGTGGQTHQIVAKVYCAAEADQGQYRRARTVIRSTARAHWPEQTGRSQQRAGAGDGPPQEPGRSPAMLTLPPEVPAASRAPASVATAAAPVGPAGDRLRSRQPEPEATGWLGMRWPG